MDLDYEESDFLEEDPLPFVPMGQVDNVFDVKPLLNALRFVVIKGREKAYSEPNDDLVSISKIAQAALIWWEYDRKQDIENAEIWINKIPKIR